MSAHLHTRRLRQGSGDAVRAFPLLSRPGAGRSESVATSRVVTSGLVVPVCAVLAGSSHMSRRLQYSSRFDEQALEMPSNRRHPSCEQLVLIRGTGLRSTWFTARTARASPRRPSRYLQAMRNSALGSCATAAQGAGGNSQAGPHSKAADNAHALCVSRTHLCHIVHVLYDPQLPLFLQTQRQVTMAGSR